MKSNSIFFTTLTLAAPLAFLLQAGALAQANGGTNTPPPAQDAGAPAATPQDNVEFFFPGGTPDEFVAAMEKQYKVDWAKVADIPNNMRNVHIPALRMNRQSADTIVGPRRFGPVGVEAGSRNPLHALIALYNSLQQAKPELGNLIVEGDLTRPSVVIFHSSTAPAMQPDRKMKAFALKGIPENEWGKLQEEINSQIEMEIDRQYDEMKRMGRGPVLLEKANVSVHQNTGLLIVDGPQWSVEAAESFVTAWPSNHSISISKVFKLGGIPENEWETLSNLADERLRKLARNQAVDQGSKGALVRVMLDRRSGSLVVVGTESVQEAAECIVETARQLAPANSNQPPHEVLLVPVQPPTGQK